MVLITTKTGKEGKAAGQLQYLVSAKASIPEKLDLMNAYDFARTVNTQFASTGNARHSPASGSPNWLNGSTDWQRTKAASGTLNPERYQLGRVRVVHRMSATCSPANYTDQPGLILNQYYKRTTLRANIDAKLRTTRST